MFCSQYTVTIAYLVYISITPTPKTMARHTRNIIL